jgi:hypothetical protein
MTATTLGIALGERGARFRDGNVDEQACVDRERPLTAEVLLC